MRFIHILENYQNKIKTLIIFKRNYKKILIIMSPVIPHFTNECLMKINHIENIKWPIVDKKYLILLRT